MPKRKETFVQYPRDRMKPVVCPDPHGNYYVGILFSYTERTGYASVYIKDGDKLVVVKISELRLVSNPDAVNEYECLGNICSICGRKKEPVHNTRGVTYCCPVCDKSYIDEVNSR